MRDSTRSKLEHNNDYYEDQLRLVRACNKCLVNNISLAPHKGFVKLTLLSFNGWLNMSLRGLSDLLKVIQLVRVELGLTPRSVWSKSSVIRTWPLW